MSTHIIADVPERRGFPAGVWHGQDRLPGTPTVEEEQHAERAWSLLNNGISDTLHGLF